MLFVVLAIPFFSQVVFAQGAESITVPDPSLNLETPGPKNPEDIKNLLITVVQWFYTIIFIVAVLFILLSAFSFITSKGDAIKVASAKRQLLYAVIGIVVALISYTIIELVKNTIQGNF